MLQHSCGDYLLMLKCYKKHFCVFVWVHAFLLLYRKYRITEEKLMLDCDYICFTFEFKEKGKKIKILY